MNNFSDIIYLDPNSIQVSNRQRTEILLDDLLDSILRNGVINPIIIKAEIDEYDITKYKSYYLVAGERRLEACKKLNLQIPCRLLSSLSPFEAQLIEFEENHKRKNLPWRDEVKAIGKIYDLARNQTPPLTRSQISKSLSIDESRFSQLLHLYKNLDEKIISYAQNLTQALSLLHKFKSEKSQELEENLKKTLGSKPIPDYLKPLPKKSDPIDLNFDDPEPISPPTRSAPAEQSSCRARPVSQIIPKPIPSILNTNFMDWILSYDRQKFDFIHCDFPNSEENFWPIFNCFMRNLSKILNNQAHIMFWLKMHFYEEVINEFRCLNKIISTQSEPLIWYKSDTKQNYVFGKEPKSTYETALIITHGNRPFKKQIQNIYATPRASEPTCPNQKSLGMLKYFFQTFIDSETNFFDPTCGSGSALIAAEELKAQSVLGLELNKSRFEKASEKLIKSREMRKILEK